MTTAQADPVWAATPNASQDDVDAHAYTWYDPDAAAFDLDESLDELGPLPDGDALAAFDWD